MSGAERIALNERVTFAEVAAFTKEHGLSPTRFGREALGDPKLFSDLQNGRQPNRATSDRLRLFMARYRPGQLRVLLDDKGQLHALKFRAKIKAVAMVTVRAKPQELPAEPEPVEVIAELKETWPDSILPAAPPAPPPAPVLVVAAPSAARPTERWAEPSAPPPEPLAPRSAPPSPVNPAVSRKAMLDVAVFATGRAFCAQCDRRVYKAEAAACRSAFCKLRVKT